MQRKASDRDRWIDGMQRLQEKFLDSFSAIKDYQNTGKKED